MVNLAEGARLSFTLAGTDPDGDPLTYSSSALPAGASLNPASGAFDWTPDSNQSGSYTVTFAVKDPAGLSASETISITVTDAAGNRAPVCSAAYPRLKKSDFAPVQLYYTSKHCEKGVYLVNIVTLEGLEVYIKMSERRHQSIFDEVEYLALRAT